MADDFFSEIKQETVSTSAGPRELPILYRDGSVVGLMYRVAPELVAPLIPHPDHFEPFTLLGKAIVQLVVFEYRDTSIGPYGELALAVEVKRRGTSPSTFGALVNAKNQPDYGSCFLNLPVTTEGACAAGKEIWGYPKYVVSIETSFTKERIHVVQSGELELEVGPAGWLETRGIPFVLMSVLGDKVIRTIVETNHPLSWGGAGSVQLKVTGSGPTADNLTKLGLPGAKPAFVWRASKLQSILPRGEALP
ncbi:MAG: acetoacetate decarboxylase family protein [Polyangiaceae bacterium]|nr:acetoacetate decarboxylase family protein [Polyangiaceae bacterium]